MLSLSLHFSFPSTRNVCPLPYIKDEYAKSNQTDRPCIILFSYINIHNFMEGELHFKIEEKISITNQIGKGFRVCN